MTTWDHLTEQQAKLDADIETYLTEQCALGIWVTSGGAHIPIHELNYGHLNNITIMINSAGPSGDRWMYRSKLRRELRRRSQRSTQHNVDSSTG